MLSWQATLEASPVRALLDELPSVSDADLETIGKPQLPKGARIDRTRFACGQEWLSTQSCGALLPAESAGRSVSDSTPWLTLSSQKDI